MTADTVWLDLDEGIRLLTTNTGGEVDGPHVLAVTQRLRQAVQAVVP